MTKLRVILAILLAAASAGAGDVRAWLYRSPGAAGGYSDYFTASPKYISYFNVLATDSYVLDGTNVVSWTDLKASRTAASTNAAMRPWFDADFFGGRGAMAFSGAQALDFISTPIPSTNVTILAVVSRSSTAHFMFVLGRGDSTGGPYFSAANNSTFYFHPGNPDGTAATISSYWNKTNSFVLGGSHSGGAVSTNSTKLFENGVLLALINPSSQASPSNSFTRIGGRADLFSTCRISAIAVAVNLSEEELVADSGKLKNMFGF